MANPEIKWPDDYIIPGANLYHQEEAGLIYLGDCLDILPNLPKVDLVLTDPPYGINGGVGLGKIRGKGNYNKESFNDSPDYIKNVIVPIINNLLIKSDCLVMTPGNRCFTYYPQPDSFGCFYQPAAIGIQRFGNLDSQPIFYYGNNITKINFGKPCSFKLTESPDKTNHPCSKPLKMWSKLLSLISLKTSIVLDPFLGSGTTAVAAKELGRKFIGIEISEEYCKIAVKRLRQGVLNFD